ADGAALDNGKIIRRKGRKVAVVSFGKKVHQKASSMLDMPIIARFITKNQDFLHKITFDGLTDTL
ncbi:MAG: hypothetical protein ACLS76_10595, partial [Eubacterium callanderi]